ncbi:NADPH--cytochrome P450 reductase [Oopsacas minuta]|uniref:NADPH--cytochrome P450 reductase n=1 Tax=Oopsacas minuta TaxID=111878 RepID=A0AAV7J9F3_9METZ|nr:NADPH--cytochrome P450 reductase [Oopsacas minuta]
MLAQYTSDDEESYKLAKLSSKEGATDYGTLIRHQSSTLMDVLYTFPSCNPPLSRLIEFLLPLNPRYYSICNSPLTSEDTIKIVFSLVHLNTRPWHPNNRYGLCTSWLKTLSTQLMTSTTSQGVKQKIELSIIARMVNTFHLPGDVTRPIIMVGPGTGVAPFIGFLEHRERVNNSQGIQFGSAHLFFGCRHSEGDFLFKEELNNFKTNNILTKLETAFSRDPNHQHHYVQDSMIENGNELIRLVLDENAVIYLCGDVNNMAPDVRAAWIKIFEKFGGLTPEEALSYLKELLKSKRYIQDIWA